MELLSYQKQRLPLIQTKKFENPEKNTKKRIVHTSQKNNSMTSTVIPSCKQVSFKVTQAECNLWTAVPSCDQQLNQTLMSQVWGLSPLVIYGFIWAVEDVLQGEGESCSSSHPLLWSSGALHMAAKHRQYLVSFPSPVLGWDYRVFSTTVALTMPGKIREIRAGLGHTVGQNHKATQGSKTREVLPQA